MKYQNPIIRGFYPDPSVCEANGKYYLVSSSFHYFPGVPLFESEDLINWKQIGHVLTRHSQVMLDKIRSSGGVFAPTIRYHQGRFYMVTNNNSTDRNFYVYTDDIYGEWSDPIEVAQDGIDPSLLFDEGHVYFLSNGHDDNGVNGIIQCEIDIETGKKLTPGKCIWAGSGGRYLESPHMYHIGDSYYIMAAEGGTEYGHMITYAKGNSPWGPFTDYPHNPVLTNRNKAPFLIQGIGHGDLIQNPDGQWFVISLGFRQIHMWMPYHHLGREVFMTPVNFNKDGWFSCGDGTTDYSYELPGDAVQIRKNVFSFENTDWNIDWCYLRKQHPENYQLDSAKALLTGSDVTLDMIDSPTFIGLRQLDFNMNLEVNMELIPQSPVSHAGITIFGCEKEHYDLFIRPRMAAWGIDFASPAYEAVLRLNIGDIKHEQFVLPLKTGKCTLRISSSSCSYFFSIVSDETEYDLGSVESKYLSSEVSSGFTGVILGLFAEGKCQAEFTDFSCVYDEIEL